jgi:hypothetical protein
VVSFFHQYPCVLGPLVSKIKITWTQALWYQNSKSDNLENY